MTVRTTATAVRKIIEIPSSKVDGDIDPFIETANDLVTENCTDSGYSDAKLELIERWLSAHFYAVMESPPAGETAGDVSENKQYQVGLGLDETKWGQQAKIIDSAGNLAALDAQSKGSGSKMSLSWLGTKLRRTDA